MKLKIYSHCLYTKLAINALFKDYLSNLKGNLIVLDSRNFNSVREMKCIAKFYSIQSDNYKIVVILNRRFIKADRELLGCGININDSLSRWGFYLNKIMNDNNSLPDSLLCLRKYSGNMKVSKKLLSIMALIAKGKPVYEIASLMHINVKTVYSHITKLKSLFHQANISHLYVYLKEHIIIDEISPVTYTDLK